LGLIDADALREVDAEVSEAIERAVEYAEASEAPDPEEVTTDVYVSWPEPRS
jgi:pyruvate dehydrogenase E1 component alpha subunit